METTNSQTPTPLPKKAFRKKAVAYVNGSHDELKTWFENTQEPNQVKDMLSNVMQAALVNNEDHVMLPKHSQEDYVFAINQVKELITIAQALYFNTTALLARAPKQEMEVMHA